MDPTLRDALLARIRFYRDLGLTEFYRRPVDPALALSTELGAPDPSVDTWDTANASSPSTPGAPSFPQHFAERVGDHTASSPTTMGAPGLASETWDPSIASSAIPTKKSTPALVLQDRAAALQLIRDDIGDCTRCALHKGRNKIVFADGSPIARLFFVGEGPGADEDAQGLPFVGRAGQLLNNMINAMGLKRDEVYIANVVKCRPPGNRTPEPEEANTCSPFLFRQIEVVRPEVIVALGATAATYLLGARQPLAGLRGRVHRFRDAKLIVTYHPAYLLRDPRQKKEAWADLQIAMRELGLKAPGKA